MRAHSKIIKAWVAQRKELIELFYLPSYSPELNPDLKLEMARHVPIRTKTKLREAANEHMTTLNPIPSAS